MCIILFNMLVLWNWVGFVELVCMHKLMWFQICEKYMRIKDMNIIIITLMSLVKAWISAVKSIHCSSSCCCFCMLLLSCSFSALVSFTALFRIWIWSCWSWISLRFSSILLEAGKRQCQRQKSNFMTQSANDKELNQKWINFGS